MSQECGKAPVKVMISVIGLALVVIGVILGLKTCRQPEQETAVTQPRVTDAEKDQGGGKEAPPVKTQTVIHYNTQENDDTFQARLAKRKADFGLNEGVDIIAKPGETLKIGDSVVPMQEILDKIRLEKGDIVEKDLADASSLDAADIQKGRMLAKLDTMQKRYAELEKKIEDPTVDPNDEANAKTAKEYDNLKETLSTYDSYKQLAHEIEQLQDKTTMDDADSQETLIDQIADLKVALKRVENDLRNRVFPDERSEAYGVYVVQPMDNIWNIHFKFLKEYFAHRGISLTPLSDEPNDRGISSGIGKLLKFSESMVYIYNLRERRLDMDLNLIQPLTKIVIFNMGQVFSMLAQIDYTNVNRIQFDGETLWIPAEQ